LRVCAAARLIVVKEFLAAPDALKVTGDDPERAAGTGGSE